MKTEKQDIYMRGKHHYLITTVPGSRSLGLYLLFHCQLGGAVSWKFIFHVYILLNAETRYR